MIDTRLAERAASEVSVQTQIDASGCAVVRFAGADGNRFDAGLIAALNAAICAALAEPRARALVIAADGPDFCAGPWRDLPPPSPEPATVPAVLESLVHLCTLIKGAERPVVALVQGRVTSGGLALALAAQRIIATQNARFHFPEPALARFPPGGALVRMAQRVGPEATLRLAFAARPWNAQQAQAAEIVDARAPGTGLDAAREMALALADKTENAASSNSAHLETLADSMRSARARLPVPLPPHRHVERDMIDTIEAAFLLPPDQALAFDLIRAQDASVTPAARAQAHLARATRRALDTPEARARSADPVLRHRLALVMSPDTVASRAVSLLRSGLEIRLVDPDRDRLARGLQAIAQAQEQLVRGGALASADAQADWARLSGAALAGACDGVLADADAAVDTELPMVRMIAPAGATLPSGVSLALSPGSPPRVAEVGIGVGGDAGAARLASEIAIRLRVTPVRVAVASVLGTLLRARQRAAARLAQLGADMSALVEAGLLAQVPSSAGPAEPVPLPAPAETLMVLAMVTAGARLLLNGNVLRPGDIDLLMVLSGAWPAWRGGPMAEGDTMGPLVLRREMDKARALGPMWEPVGVLDEMVRHGWRFEDLNTG